MTDLRTERPRHLWVADPGKMSGLVTLDTETNEFSPFELGFDDMCRTLMSAVDIHHTRGGLLLISESFIITQQTGKNTQAPWSLELIGVMRMISQIYLGRSLVLQQPASAKRFSSDDRLRRLGWYTPKKGHANDAARHLLLLMATRGLLPQEVLHEFAEMP
jgi:hypothetical protein